MYYDEIKSRGYILHLNFACKKKDISALIQTYTVNSLTLIYTSRSILKNNQYT